VSDGRAGAGPGERPGPLLAGRCVPGLCAGAGPPPSCPPPPPPPCARSTRTCTACMAGWTAPRWASRPPTAASTCCAAPWSRSPKRCAALLQPPCAPGVLLQQQLAPGPAGSRAGSPPARLLRERAAGAGEAQARRRRGLPPLTRPPPPLQVGLQGQHTQALDSLVNSATGAQQAQLPAAQQRPMLPVVGGSARAPQRGPARPSLPSAPADARSLPDAAASCASQPATPCRHPATPPLTPHPSPLTPHPPGPSRACTR
jgi:hypothetical protein